MAKHPLRSLPVSLLALIGVMALGATASSSPSPAESAIPPAAPSPKGDADEADLICHTTNPADCYPKLFRATDTFQRVHHDQDLPKGLHVRLNVQTGEKEAKINIPDEPLPPSLQNLPVDQSIVLVDSPDSEDADKPPIPLNAPRYDPAGKIKEPAPDSSSTSFHRSLQFLKKGLDVDQALESLEEVSHDIYYGLQLASDAPTVRQLFCLAYHSPPSDPPSRARLAALALGSAVQNNPKALASVSAHWTHALRADAACPAAAAFVLGSADPALAKARAAALSGLLRDPVIRGEFLASGAMETSVLEALVGSRADEAAWEGTRRVVANLVLDNFLDEGMGAALGEFPRGRRAGDAECAAAAEGLEGGCWDWHAERLAKKYKGEGKDHWSAELARKVKEQRKVNNSSKGQKGKKQEL